MVVLTKALAARRKQAGFTLIELLIVVTILGVLAAVVTLSLIGITANAKTQACKAELSAVQTAMDSYLAANDTSAVPGGAVAAETNSMPAFLTTGYLRQSTTKGNYTWTAAGVVSQPHC